MDYNYWRHANTLADGTEFVSWEKPQVYSKTYHVAQKHPKASDKNPGTEDAPFATIGAAARVLKPGERVVIHSGLYRETVRPARGGTGPDKMISYESAPGEEVVISGSVEINDGFKEAEGWCFFRRDEEPKEIKVWELDISGLDFQGYNPFGMINVLQDRLWLWHKRIPMDPFFKRRGMVFVDGEPLMQVEHPRDMGASPGRFWVHHNGTRIYLRLRNDDDWKGHKIELAIREQLFVPEKRGIGYIKIKGLTFRHGANGFPVPQRGLVSAARGHHFIIEDCKVEWANSVGIDLGNECWNATRPVGEFGHHIVRRNIIRQCGICGLAAFNAPGFLIEDNLVEDCGWQNCEHMYESGGIKVHQCSDLLFRRNVLRRIRHASGFWLDCTNVNCRISGNLFYDIDSRAAAVHFEGTHFPNRVDHNIIAYCRTQDDADGNPGMGGHGIQAEGTDKLTVDHNLIFGCENEGFYSDTVAQRIIDGRGGTARKNRVTENIILHCERSAVAFANIYNYADGNVYGKLPGGFIRVGTPIPEMKLDIEGVRDFLGWEENAVQCEAKASLDMDSLVLTVTGLPDTTAGPFESGGDIKVKVDPRQLETDE